MRYPRVITAGIAALLLSVAGAAYGAFTATGSGTGAATTGTMATVSVAALSGQTPTTLLQPGASGEVVVSVHNPNTYAVRVVSVVAAGSIVVSGGSGCTAGNSGVTFTDQTALSVAVPASTTQLLRLAGAVAMSSSSASGCQGATFSIPVTVTAETP